LGNDRSQLTTTEKAQTIHFMVCPVSYGTILPESAIPRQWYNIRADMRTPVAPLLNPGTSRPMTLEEMSAVFCTELAQQELDDMTP
jgi:tryptophan synthase beta chain